MSGLTGRRDALAVFCAPSGQHQGGQNECELGARICQWSAVQSAVAVRLDATGHPVVTDRAPAASATPATRLRQTAAASVHPATDPARCLSAAVPAPALAATGLRQSDQSTRRRPAVSNVRHRVRAVVPNTTRDVTKERNDDGAVTAPESANLAGEHAVGWTAGDAAGFSPAAGRSRCDAARTSAGSGNGSRCRGTDLRHARVYSRVERSRGPL